MSNELNLLDQALCVSDLCAGYGKQDIVSHVSFSLPKGEVVGILGPNGCGKTTLLKALCGLLSYKGSIELEGQDLRKLSVKARARLTGYIPQRSGLSIDLSLLDVVLMGFNPQLSLLQYPTEDMKKRALEALGMVGLIERAGDNYQELSEGQKQLCLLARTMVIPRPLLLLDEPESALDFGGRYQMLHRLSEYVKEQNGLALVTLHDPQLALHSCDRLLLMREGKLLGQLIPAKDPVEEMAEKLTALFGPLSLHRLADGSGQDHLVLLHQ